MRGKNAGGDAEVTYMPFLLTLVTGLVLVGVSDVDASLSRCTGGRQAVPVNGSMIGVLKLTG